MMIENNMHNMKYEDFKFLKKVRCWTFHKKSNIHYSGSLPNAFIFI